MSKAKYDAIAELGDEVSWFCVVCKISVPKVLETVSNISNRMDTLETELSEVKDRVETLESTTEPNTLKSFISNECKDIIRIQNDRVRRQNNVIMYGLNNHH